MFLNLWLLAASTPADQSMTSEAVCARTLPSKYTTQTGDTIDLIAKKFRLQPITVLGANPAIQERSPRPGDVLTILPKDGILYKTKPEERFPEIAQRFRVSADILFEINGCQMRTELFIPGVLWSSPAKPKPSNVLVPQQSPLPVLRLPPPPVVSPLPASKKKSEKKSS